MVAKLFVGYRRQRRWGNCGPRSAPTSRIIDHTPSLTGFGLYGLPVPVACLSPLSGLWLPSWRWLNVRPRRRERFAGGAKPAICGRPTTHLGLGMRPGWLLPGHGFHLSYWRWILPTTSARLRAEDGSNARWKGSSRCTNARLKGGIAKHLCEATDRRAERKFSVSAMASFGVLTQGRVIKRKNNGSPESSCEMALRSPCIRWQNGEQ